MRKLKQIICTAAFMLTGLSLKAGKHLEENWWWKDKISEIETEIQLTENNLARHYAQNDTFPTAIDSVIAFLEVENFADAKLILTDALLQKGDTARAQQLVDSLELISGYENFARIKEIQIAYADTLFSSILEDSVLFEELQTIASDTEKVGALEARIILEQITGEPIPPVIVFASPQPALRTAANTTETREIEDSDFSVSEEIYEGYLLSAQPNPFHNKTVIHAYIPPVFPESEIQVTSVFGEIIRKLQLKKGHNYIEFDAANLPNGILFYTLVIDGYKAETKKLLLLK